MILLTAQSIDVAPLLATAQAPAAGAVVLFMGITRESTAGRTTETLDYEAYADMAERELRRMADEATRRWSLEACCIAHRTGRVPVSEPSVAVVASSAHRPEAFAAARWLIDEIKRTAPIWKREHYTDGSLEWVHPTDGLQGT